MPRPKGALPNSCGAKTRSGKPCMRSPVKGKKRCRQHGGLSTGPRSPEKMKGNKNSLKHGAHETIYLDSLEPDEAALVASMDMSTKSQTIEEIKLITVRISRMMKRIQRLKGDSVTYQSKSTKSGPEVTLEGFSITKIETDEGFGPMGPIDKESKTYESTLGNIQKIESEITKAQEKKKGLLELLYKIESGAGDSMPDINVFLNALTATGEDVWGDESEDDSP